MTFAPEAAQAGRAGFGLGRKAARDEREAAGMTMVEVGDRLLPDGDARRAGVIIRLPKADGTPPYVVRWLSDGHISLTFPGPYARIVRDPGAARKRRAE